jgi:hypothetical protein
LSTARSRPGEDVRSVINRRNFVSCAPARWG